MNTCKKCIQYSGWTMLILGVLFLLRDLDQFNVFGDIGEWAIVLIVFGLCAAFACGKCSSCNAEGSGKAAGKRRRR